MIKAIIFDCFGVVYEDRFDKVWESLGGDLARDNAFIKKTFRDSHKGVIPSSASLFAEYLGITTEEFLRANDDGRKIDDQILEFISELKKSYKVGMLSNIGATGLNKYIPQHVLDEYFEVVVQSSQIGYAKPEANAYEITADRLGVRCDECVMVDDRPEYVDGATAVGMKAILYQNLDQLKADIISLI